MKRIIVFTFIIFIFISTSAFAKLRVTTTTFILSDIVKQIGKDKITVSYLIPSGANPHIFSPKPRSLEKLIKSDIFIGVGFGFEFWFDKIRYLTKNRPVLFLSDYYKTPIDLKVINSEKVANPHIWLDINFIKDVAIFKIADEFCRLDKSNCQFYKNNAKQFQKRLKNLSSNYKQTFSSMKDFCFLDIKPAFEYMLRSFNVKSCSVLIKKGNREPKIRDISCALGKCRCKKGAVLYINDKQLAQMMASKLHYKQIELNPLGDPKVLRSYEILMKHNLDCLQKIVQ